MKEIPRRQNMRRRGKEAPKAIEEDNKSQPKEVNNSEPQQVPKTKKIHHQTLKAMERRKKAEEEKLKNQEEVPQNKVEIQIKTQTTGQQKIENAQKIIPTQNKPKTPLRGAKTNRRFGRHPNKVPAQQTLHKYFAPIENSMAGVQVNKQKLNQNSQVSEQRVENPQNLNINSAIHGDINANASLGLSLVVPAKKHKTTLKPIQTTQLTYYNNHYDNIFDVLIPIDDLDEQILIFDKNHPIDYQQLVDKIHKLKHQPINVQQRKQMIDEGQQ